MVKIKRIKNILILVISTIIISFVLIEIILRIILPNPVIDSEPYQIIRLSKNLNLQFELKPNFKGYFGRVQVNINSDGFREDKEYSVKKPAGFKRIIILGDSVSFGYGIKNKYTFAKRLEEKLCKNKYNYKIINTGVAGYDTKHEYYTLLAKGLKYNPDIVILVFCLNDIGNPLHIRGLKYIGKKKLIIRISNFLRKYLYIYNFLNTRYRYLITRWGYLARKRELKDILITKNNKKWLKNSEYLSLIKSVCIRNRIELIVLIVPYEIQISKKYIKEYEKKYNFKIPLKVLENIPQKILKNYLSRKQIRYIDLLEPFKNSKKKLYNNEDWIHLNSDGHELVSNILYDYILKKYVIDSVP